MKKENNENVIQSYTMLVETIVKPTGDELIVCRGGSPQNPLTLFVGSPKEFADFICNKR